MSKFIVIVMGILFFSVSLAVPSKKMTRTSFRPGAVWIMKTDGALSCDPQSGVSLAEGAEELRKANIQVLDSKKGSDGRMHIMVCGAPQGTTNTFLIPRDKLPLARAKGFEVVPGTDVHSSS